MQKQLVTKRVMLVLSKAANLVRIYATGEACFRECSDSPTKSIMNVEISAVLICLVYMHCSGKLHLGSGTVDSLLPKNLFYFFGQTSALKTLLEYACKGCNLLCMNWQERAPKCGWCVQCAYCAKWTGNRMQHQMTTTFWKTLLMTHSTTPHPPPLPFQPPNHPQNRQHQQQISSPQSKRVEAADKCQGLVIRPVSVLMTTKGRKRCLWAKSWLWWGDPIRTLWCPWRKRIRRPCSSGNRRTDR